MKNIIKNNPNLSSGTCKSRRVLDGAGTRLDYDPPPPPFPHVVSKIKFQMLLVQQCSFLIKTTTANLQSLSQERCNQPSSTLGLAHATAVHERNTVPYAGFSLKKRHGFCAKAREKNIQRHRLGTL